MDLNTLRLHWDRFGASDPLWAVLSAPERRLGGWNEEEFFLTGVTEIEKIFVELDDLGVVIQPGRALDFGCGVGRLTAALASRFKQLDGVDIAPSMVAQARRRFGEDKRLAFHLIEDDSLSLFPSATFDFIYTAHVLQHMEPRFSERYVHEFLRALTPGGVAVLQVTTEPYVAADYADGCLSADGYRARLGLVRGAHFRAGERAVISVLVVNDSDSTWYANGTRGWFMVTVGNRWRTIDGDLVVADDGRVSLPKDLLLPGESAVVELNVKPPDRRGGYLLEVDVVQEGCAWFGDRGSIPVRIPVELASPSRGLLGRAARRLPPGMRRPLRAIRSRFQDPVASKDQPVMEMYGVPEPTMAQWIEDAGGSLISVFDWAKIAGQGTDWERRVFVVTKKP